ncbi:MAG: hypothetical protein ACE5JR_04515 [Gemmatimonadota bacterium]
MRLRTKWAFAGMIWGGLAGGLGAAGSVGGGAGVFWLYLFGEDTWPAWGARLLQTLAAATFVGLVALGTLVGLRHGRRQEADGHGRDPDAHRVATRAATAGAIAALAAVALFIGAERQQRARRDRAATAEQALADLRETRHRITALEAVPAGPEGSVAILLGFAGARRGPYAVTVQLQHSMDAKTVWSRTDTVELRAGGSEHHLEVGAQEIKAGLHPLLFADETRPTADADVTLRVRAVLVPILGAELRERLPERELHNLELASASLIDELMAEVKLSLSFP